MRQRGITGIQLLVYAGVAAGLIATAWGAIAWHASVHFERGEASMKAKWDADKIAAAALERQRRAVVDEALAAEQKRADDAESLAAKNERKWKEALREGKRKQLAVCAPGPAEPPATDLAAGEPGGTGVRAPSAGGDRAPGLGVRLTWRFVGLHDGAFTGLDGQPVFGASADFALDASRADAASPYGLDELLEVHGENARALGACLRAYDSALKKIDDAAASWGRAQ